MHSRPRYPFTGFVGNDGYWRILLKKSVRLPDRRSARQNDSGSQVSLETSCTSMPTGDRCCRVDCAIGLFQHYRREADRVLGFWCRLCLRWRTLFGRIAEGKGSTWEDRTHRRNTSARSSTTSTSFLRKATRTRPPATSPSREARGDRPRPRQPAVIRCRRT